MYLKSHQLIALALATVIFPRIVTALGAPSLVNFMHFAIVPAIFVLACYRMPRWSLPLLGATLVLFGVITLSAFLTEAGVVNVLLDFLLLAEPFLLLLAITNVRWSSMNIKGFSFWLLVFSLANASIAYYQRLALGLVGDDVKGVFADMGAGHHLAGAVALSAAAYFLADSSIRSMWLRISIAAFFVPVAVFTDAKQAIAVFLVSLVILSLWKLGTKNAGTALGYLGVTIIGGGVAFWMSVTVFPALAVWADPELISTGLTQKFSVFGLIASYYESALNVLVGLGPGHTIGRLGQMLPNYLPYLEPFGATTSPVTEAVWQAQQGHWITNSVTGSSMWSPMFSWAGVWGDLGLLGLGAYLYLWLIVWRKYCADDLSRFFLINVLVFGCVFAWMEEPGYVLFVIAIIGLRWQRHQSETKARSTTLPEQYAPVEGYALAGEAHRGERHTG